MSRNLVTVEWKVKRLLDILIALLGGFLLLPVCLLIALVIKMQSRGPALFKQRRIGQGGKEFEIIKFRTMSEGDHSLVTPRNPDGSMAIKDGNKTITPIGRFLRRWSLDEIPQLINVLKGDMSLVGPRPDLPFQVAEYDGKAKRRLAVRPGITGLAQIAGRNELSFAERRELDLEYIKNYSLWLDLKILLATPIVVLSGRGLYPERRRDEAS